MGQEKIKRFIDCYIPTETCNLKCHYCYIAQLKKFNNKIVEFEYSNEHMRKALSKDRLGGTCLLNLCAGGETLIAKEIIPLIKELLEEGHYVMVVTNGTLSQRFDEISKFPTELLERLFFKFSFHYLELIRLNSMDKFFDNIKKVRDAGCSFTLEITPSDELIPHIEDVKKICIDKFGTLSHITIARNDISKKIIHLSKHDFEEYKKIWSTFDSDLFSFKSKIFYKKRKEFCYAGDWSMYLNMVTGDVRQCYGGPVFQNLYKDVEKPLKLLPVGKNCRMAHCYNGHAFIALGVIPELDYGNYAELRNREDNTGEWLNLKMKQFMSTKLKDSNTEYDLKEKRKINIKNKIIMSNYFIKKVKNKFTKK